MANGFSNQDPVVAAFDFKNADDSPPSKIEDVKTGSVSSVNRHSTICAVIGRSLKQHALTLAGPSADWDEKLKKIMVDGWNQMHNVNAIRWWCWLIGLLPYKPSGAGHTKSFMIEALISARQRCVSPTVLLAACKAWVASSSNPKSDWVFPKRSPIVYIPETGVDDPVLSDMDEDDDDSDEDDNSSASRSSSRAYQKGMLKIMSTVAAALNKSKATLPDESEGLAFMVKSQKSKLETKLLNVVAEGISCNFWIFTMDYRNKVCSLARSEDKHMVMAPDGSLSTRSVDTSKRIESWDSFSQAFVNYIRLLSLVPTRSQLIDDHCAFFCWLSNAAFPHGQKLSYFEEFWFLYSDDRGWMHRKSTDASLLAEFLSNSSRRRNHDPPGRIGNQHDQSGRFGNRGNANEVANQKRKKKERREREARERRNLRNNGQGSDYNAPRRGDRHYHSPPASPKGGNRPSKRKHTSSSSSSSSSSHRAICFSSSDESFVCSGAKCRFRHECSICKGNHSLIDHV
jgi:hypothetical protein